MSEMGMLRQSSLYKLRSDECNSSDRYGWRDLSRIHRTLSRRASSCQRGPRISQSLGSPLFRKCSAAISDLRRDTVSVGFEGLECNRRGATRDQGNSL